MPPKSESIHYIKPKNHLAQKAGKGGIDDKTLKLANKIIEDYTCDFMPQAYEELLTFKNLVQTYVVSQPSLTTDVKHTLFTPIMTIKANAGLFNYKMLYEITDTILYIIDYINDLNSDAQSLLELNIKIVNHILERPASKTLDDFETGLLNEIDDAIQRYKNKYPNPKADEDRRR